MAKPTTGQARRAEDAADAWARGRAATDPQEALFWLERTARLAPDDPRPSLEAALIAAASGTPEATADAAARLETIARLHDCALAWQGLARLRLRAGDAPGAAAALAALCARHILPDACIALADAVTQAQNGVGWCALDAQGRLRLGALPPGATPTLRRDGQIIPGFDAHAARHAARLEVSLDGISLLGAPLDLTALRRVEGVVSAEQTDLRGWAFHRAAAGARPRLLLRDARGAEQKLRLGAALPPVQAAPFHPRFSFRLRAAALATLTPPFTITSSDGAALYGSPIDPTALAQLRPPGTSTRQQPPTHLPARADLLVLIPAYRDAARTQATLDSLEHAAPDVPVLVIDDASPEPALRALLTARARGGRIMLHRLRTNRGFPGAVNAGLARAARTHPDHDILLLNADTLVPPHAIARLHHALYAAPDIASVTPFSNEATILSYPDPAGGNPAPDLPTTTALNARAWRVNGAALTPIPTAIGFCMAIRHDSLAATGRLRAAIFAQGYGEENDWCLRARALGYRHMAAPGIFVAHCGGASFGAAGRALLERNLALLDQLYPDYAGEIAAFQTATPLAPARRRLDRARFLADHRNQPAVALITHDHGGGIARVLTERIAALRAEGYRPIVIQPDFSDPQSRLSLIGAARLGERIGRDFPNLLYTLPGDWRALLALLRAARVQRVEFHHDLGHHPLLHTLAAALAVPVRLFIHDYAVFCKRYHLIGPDRLYCGEPDEAGCVRCLERAGSESTDPITPAALRARSAVSLQSAEQVIVPSADVAQRLRRHFPKLVSVVQPWETDLDTLTLRAPRRAARRIAVLGGIGPAKGFDMLRACAVDANARDLPLDFVLVGASEHDRLLLETGRVRITGPYPEGEGAALTARMDADLAFIPSIWPETWCFTLSEAWRAGLYTVVFDLGAQAARVRASQRGLTLPLGLPPTRINDALLAWQPDLGNLMAPLPIILPR